MDQQPKHDDSSESHQTETPFDVKGPVDTGIHEQHRPLKHIVVIVFVVLLTIVLSAAAMWLYIHKTAKPTPTSSTTHFSSATDLISQATASEIKGDVLDPAKNTNQGGISAEGFTTYSLPSYKVANNNYENFPTEGTGQGYITNSVAADQNYKQFIQFFKDNHFTKLSTASGSGPISIYDDVNFVSYAVYGSVEMLCAIWHVDASATALKQHVTSIGCASKDSYTKAADIIKPFYESYTKNDKARKNLVFSVPTISNGKDGYKNAFVYIEDGTGDIPDLEDKTVPSMNGYYYMQPGNGTWTFFAALDTRKSIYCSAFDTPVLQKAFNGVDCINSTTDTPSSIAA